ncbi:MAG: thioesterase family protein [Bacteroidales bacterium]|nr:thioesterase family protein [Bacteroidales bacterium]MBQ7819743.1 thioesterase family protein [Bacteroidales bacterium]
MMDKVEYCSKKVVGEVDTAQSVGSGTLPVLATPMMVALMENAAMNAAEKLLSEEETTVGSELNIRHLRPTAVGEEIEATAILTLQEGRKLTFSVTASDKNGTIGEGIHVRYIVNIEKFMQKL